MISSPPDEKGQRCQVYGHSLVGVDATLPHNDLTWECEDCGKSAIDPIQFTKFNCGDQ